MQLTEQQIIKQTHALYGVVDGLLGLAKNLYNSSVYDVRQYYFSTGKYKSWQTQKGEFALLNNPDYRALPAKISGEVLMLVGRNFKSFFGSLKSQSKKKVSIPRYLPKDGKQVITFPKQAISKQVRKLENGLYEHTISPKDLNFKVITRYESVDIVRLVPRNGYHLIEIVHTVQECELVEDNGRYASLDPGINNLATIYYNTGDAPEIWCGKRVKSINQGYNRAVSKLKSQLDKGGVKRTSKRIQAHHLRRKNRLDHELHAISNSIVNQLVSKNISLLIIGKNDNWKQDTKKLGKKFNQKFIQIPFEKLNQHLKYKCELKGISVVFTEESYTSKASFLDRDLIPVYANKPVITIFTGKRTKRGTYKTPNNIINADVNGAGNIMRKVIPDSKVYYEGVEAVTIQPIKIKHNLS